MNMWEAAAREADRLRIIIDVFTHAHPAMTMDEAGPAILAAEKRAAELEAPNLPKEQAYVPLADYSPETGAALIDLVPTVQEPIRDSKLINGIKAFRAVTGWGLKESKEACVHWQDTRIKGIAVKPTPAAVSIAPADIADWIDTQTDIIAMIDVPYGHFDYKKISGIKTVRMRCPGKPGLKEAKDGVEYWIASRGYRAT